MAVWGHGSPSPAPVCCAQVVRDLTRDGRWSTHDVIVRKKMGGGGIRRNSAGIFKQSMGAIGTQ